ncbi:hypothetical protein SPONL_663 [uncultured Candidatus Thioglobus sp.]|nr:hypothetical protein SPONL_663 [uncultured Candidatus Thioglobus sp.]
MYQLNKFSWSILSSIDAVSNKYIIPIKPIVCNITNSRHIHSLEKWFFILTINLLSLTIEKSPVFNHLTISVRYIYPVFINNPTLGIPIKPHQ